MQPSQASRWITDARFAPYLAYASGDHAVAVALYVWNARISAAAFETLHHVEVLLRNAVDERFAPVDASASASATWLTDATILNIRARMSRSEFVRLLAPDTDENVIRLPAAAKSNRPLSARERAVIRWAT